MVGGVIKKFLVAVFSVTWNDGLQTLINRRLLLYNKACMLYNNTLLLYNKAAMLINKALTLYNTEPLLVSNVTAFFSRTLQFYSLSISMVSKEAPCDNKGV